MARLKNASRLSSAVLLMRIRTRLGLLVRPCDLQKVLRPGENAFTLLDRLVAKRYAVRSYTMDVGKGKVLYTLAEGNNPLGSRKRVVTHSKSRWRVAIAFVPGWPLTQADSTLKPAAGKVATVRFRRLVRGREFRETMNVRFLGTMPDGGWLVRLEDPPCPPSPRHRRKKSRRSRSKRSTNASSVLRR